MDLLISLLGWAMLAASLAAIGDGLPRQILFSHRTRTAPVVLRRFMAWALAAYLLRACYAAATGGLLIAAAAIPGAAGMAILLWQSYRYPRIAKPVAPQLILSTGADIVRCYPKGNRMIVEARGETDNGGYVIVMDDDSSCTICEPAPL